MARRRTAGVEDAIVGLIVFGFGLIVFGTYLWSTVIGVVAAGVALVVGGVVLAMIVGPDEGGAS